MNTSLYIKRLYVTALISVVAFTATLAQEFTIDGLNYRVTSSENKEVQVISGEIREEIIIPETVKNEEVTYTVTSIGDYAFSGRTSTPYTRKYVIPGTVKSIGYRAFYDNYYMEELVLNEGLETIGEWAFGYAFALDEIFIPSTVVSIADLAFCTNQDHAIDIVCYSVTPTIGENTFSGRTHIATLHVPANNLTAFQQADYWKACGPSPYKPTDRGRSYGPRADSSRPVSSSRSEWGRWPSHRHPHPRRSKAGSHA